MGAELHPFLVFYVGALLVALSRGRVQQGIMLMVPLLGVWQLIGLDQGSHWQVALLGFELELFRVDKLSLLFGFLFHLAALLGVIYALHVRDTLQQVAALVYAGSALGAVFAGDLLTLFMFWEGLALSSVFLVWARRTPRAAASGLRYLVMQVGSGVLLLAGAVVHFRATGSLAFDHLGLESPGGTLILLAFGIKCAFPLLHNWLTDAYPEATPTGAVFLSAFTTKVAVYALARGYAGTEVLIYIGAVMTCFPIFYAVIENDLRRVLAYSMINQIGFMVVGIGLGTAMAVNGAVAHAFNDVIFKSLLMMSMGAVLYKTGKINGSELGGLYKSMPQTTGLCIVGAASISAFPLFSGFVSKSLVMVATLDQGYHVIWLFLLFASAGVFHHAGIKIPYFAFFAHDAGIRTGEPPLNMRVAMAIGALLCIFIGSYPWLLYSHLPLPFEYNPFDASHVIAQVQLLFFSALAFVWLNLRGLYPPELPSVNLDAEWLYRRLLPRSAEGLVTQLAVLGGWARKLWRHPAERLLAGLFRTHGPHGSLAGTWPTGSMVLWVAVLLALMLLVSYL
ncbi:MAG: Na(+)/H(+) antiporter subunit D [Alphaproteobacteria bacterium]